LEISDETGLASYQIVQPEYNLYAREGYEKELEPVCREYGLGVITYFSLASGFLTGKYRSDADLGKSQRGGGMKKYMNDRGFKILKALDEVALEYKSTPASVAIAWVIARPGITAPIASATSTKQLKDIIAATQLNLSEESIKLLNKASSY
jgi:aryl-alcohol dehydrogenase-like predicted oxidoreductase